MASPLIFLHAMTGGLSILAFAWVAVELLRPQKDSIARAYIGAVLGLILLLTSWAMASYYYVTIYGPVVRPLVKSEAAWAHDIGMESKEHIFLFMPFLAILQVYLLHAHGRRIEPVRKTIVAVALLLVFLGLVITFEGYLISAAARAALEAKL